MKITICGKGGCGKSTVTSLLAKEFARMGKTVLVVDSDESNFGLHRQLGVELPRDYTEYFGGKDKAFKKMMAGEILDTVKLSAFAKKFFSQAFTISEIPQEYVAKKDGVMLISSGKIHRANEGCACTMNKILEQFVDHLTLSQDEIALLDTEAGVEHFGRGVDNSVDQILMVVDPSFESLELTRKIYDLGQSIGKPVHFVLNKVNNQNLSTMQKLVCDPDKILAVLPSDPEISESGLLGQELTMENTPIQHLAAALLKRSDSRGRRIPQSIFGGSRGSRTYCRPVLAVLRKRHAGNGPVCHLAGREPASVWRQSDRKKRAVRNPILGVRQAILRYFVPRQYR